MTIIVGTDGTGCSRAAVTWAAREARRRGDRLRIVHAFDGDRQESRYDIGNEFVDVARTLADAVVAAARDLALAAAPGVDLETGTVAGQVVPALLDEAIGAALLVLGHRDRVVLGSVGRRLAAEASCPVVVVCGRETPGGPVLCGLDDSPADDAVLTTAFAAAEALGCGLVVLGAPGRRTLRAPGRRTHDAPDRRTHDAPDRRTHDAPDRRTHDAPDRRTHDAPDRRTLDAPDRRTLDGRLAPWRDRFPGVPAGTVHTGRTAALVAGSRDARLMVVGSAGRRLLRQSGCPVLVAR